MRRCVQPLLAAATGAIWKCAASLSARYLEERDIVGLLIGLLEEEPENVCANVAGAIEQIVKTEPKNAFLIKKANAIPPLIGLLTINNPVLCTYLNFYTFIWNKIIDSLSFFSHF